MLEINGKKYDFHDNGKYTRALDHGHEYFLFNAPEDVTDESAARIMDGGGISQNWGYRTIPKERLPMYEVHKGEE